MRCPEMSLVKKSNPAYLFCLYFFLFSLKSFLERVCVLIFFSFFSSLFLFFLALIIMAFFFLLFSPFYCRFTSLHTHAHLHELVFVMVR